MIVVLALISRIPTPRNIMCNDEPNLLFLWNSCRKGSCRQYALSMYVAQLFGFSSRTRNSSVSDCMIECTCRFLDVHRDWSSRLKLLQQQHMLQFILATTLFVRDARPTWYECHSFVRNWCQYDCFGGRDTYNHVETTRKLFTLVVYFKNSGRSFGIFFMHGEPS